jgi:carbonic anhydrase
MKSAALFNDSLILSSYDDAKSRERIIMKKKHLLLIPSLLLLLFALNIVMSQDIHWTYEGAEGPDQWGELAPEYALCGEGRSQSPIDITGEQAVNLADLTLNYSPSVLNIFNNGHTIQVNYDAGSSLIYNENEYALEQFHFHHPSEHTLNGESFGMELHFVHGDANGAKAVVGVLLAEGSDDNTAYAPVFDNLPPEEGEPASTELMVNAADLLPEQVQYYTYMGSLTTPPCTQGVRWLVLDTPVTLSAAQLAAFEAIFELNARPVQPLNMRDLLHDIG